jgi:hypothetical protein
MMRYTVVWPEETSNLLASLWLDAPDRNEVTAAVDRIDQLLAEDAPSRGFEVSEGLRALLVPPLRILYSVREADRIVEVYVVRRV